jgi:autotransporter translocation and assembly factor TamB
MDLVLRLDGTGLDIRGAQGARKPPGVALVADAKVRSTAERLTIQSAVFTFGPLEADVDGTVLLGEPPSMALNIKSSDINLSGWESFVPAVEAYELSGTANVSARVEGALGPGKAPDVNGTVTIDGAGATLPQFLKPLSELRSEISFSGKRADVRRLSLRTGDSRIAGNATIESFAPLTAVYEVTSPSFKLADIRPPQPNVKKPEVLENITANGRMVVDEEPRGEGKVTSPSGSIANVDYNDLSATFSIEGKTIDIHRMNARALRGQIGGKGRITADEQSTAFDLEIDARQVDMTELFTALPASVRRTIRGTANLKCNISGNGREWESMQTTLNGNGLAELFDGAILDFNVANGILDKVDEFTGSTNLVSNQLKQKYPKVFEVPNTEFKNFKSDFVVDNGRLLARNLDLKHDEYQITGKGSIGLKRDLELTTNFVVSKKLTDDLIRNYKAVSYLTNSQGMLEVPVLLSGTLPNVRARPDSEYIKKVVGDALVEDGLDRLKNKYLKDLFPSKKKSDSKPDTLQLR